MSRTELLNVTGRPPVPLAGNENVFLIAPNAARPALASPEIGALISYLQVPRSENDVAQWLRTHGLSGRQVLEAVPESVVTQVRGGVGHTRRYVDLEGLILEHDRLVEWEDDESSATITLEAGVPVRLHPFTAAHLEGGTPISADALDVLEQTEIGTVVGQLLSVMDALILSGARLRRT